MRKVKFGFAGIATVAAAMALTPAFAGAATITVNNLTDELDGDGNCSLREAVESANLNVLNTTGCTDGSAGPTVDTIELEGGPYNLTLVGVEDDNATGDLDVEAGGPLTIESDVNGVRRTISSPVEDRILELTEVGADLTLRDLAITTAGNIPAEDGGVIEATNASNDLTLENVSVNGGNDDINAERGGVIALEGAGSELSISDSEIQGGDVSQQGGGIWVANAEPATITRSIVTDNRVEAPNGSSARGGGIYADSEITITDSELSVNRAQAPGAMDGDAQGGGLNALGEFTIERSLFEDNEVFSNDNAVVPASDQEDGGAIALTGAAAVGTIANSTISDNTTGNDGGDDARGGGIYSSAAGQVNVNHVTFFNNTTPVTANGDHIHNDGLGLFYRNSLIPGGGGINICEGGDATTVSGGHNSLTADDADGCDDEGPGDTATGATGIVGGGAADNGGPSIGGEANEPLRSIAINPGTALNLVPTADCAAAEGTDQRGLSRPQGGACDAGAFEVCATPGGGASLGCPPPLPVVIPPITTTPPTGGGSACSNLSGKAKKKCLCRQKKGKKRKKCLKRLKGRKS